MIQKKCLFCNSLDINKVAEGGYPADKCINCNGLKFEYDVNDEHHEIYKGDADYNSDLVSYAKPEDGILWHHEIAAKKIMQTFTLDCLGVDVGCFNGFFVKHMVDLGVNFFGSDFNSKAIADGVERFGLHDRISSASFEMSSESNKYEFVTCFEVIEHVQNPQELMQQLFRIVSPGGLVFVSCPNANMIWRPPLDQPPHHLSRITPKSLQLLSTDSGFEILGHHQQMSILDLTRHFVGTFFRTKGADSMRGGEIIENKLTRSARKLLNRYGKYIKYLVLPFDKVLFKLGVRYIGQVIILKKPIK